MGLILGSTLTVVGPAAVLLVAGVGMLVGGGPPAATPPEEPPASVPPVDTLPELPIDDLGTVSGGSDSGADVTLPLVPVPPGCTAPDMPHVVFVGTVVGRDIRSVRFRVESVRAGQVAPFALADPTAGTVFVDVRYGLDASVLDDGSIYLVSAELDPDLGVLVSRVDRPVEDFGGDDVIGAAESDLFCPEFEDPIRTLHPDGTEIGHGLLDGFLGARSRLAFAVLVPLAAAFAVVFLLSMLRLGVSGVARGLRPPGRSS